jgi:hypothetical protein
MRLTGPVATSGGLPFVVLFYVGAIVIALARSKIAQRHARHRGCSEG